MSRGSKLGAQVDDISLKKRYLNGAAIQPPIFRFLVRFWWSWNSKWAVDRPKIDVERYSILDFKFCSNFHRFRLPIWTRRTPIFKPPLQGEHDSLNIAFRSYHWFFIRFLGQVGSILRPTIHQHSKKNRFKMASIIESISASIFVPFWLQLGTSLAPKLRPSWPR